MNNNINVLLSKLDKVSPKGKGKWMACCPAHEDRSPSLAIRELSSGSVLVHCFAGCEPISIVHAVGLTMGDLFPERSEEHIEPLGFAKIEQKKAHEEANRLQKERLILALAEQDRRAGKKLSQKDLDREFQAYKALKAAGIDV